MVPFVFLMSAIFSLVLAVAGLWLPQPYHTVLSIPLALLLGLHVSAGSVAALQLSRREKSLATLALPV